MPIDELALDGGLGPSAKIRPESEERLGLTDVAGYRRLLELDRLDEAVVRSGRLGRFVPVPPPDREECVRILEYYLRRTQMTGRANQTEIEIPQGSDLQETLAELSTEASSPRASFCGADLEEAVNRAYRSCCRLAHLGTGGVLMTEQQRPSICLTRDALAGSLQAVRRSVTDDALKQFLKEVRQNCGATVADEIASRSTVG